MCPWFVSYCSLPMSFIIIYFLFIVWIIYLTCTVIRTDYFSVFILHLLLAFLARAFGILCFSCVLFSMMSSVLV